MRRKPKSSNTVTQYKIPYLNALMAYAYTNMPFKEALKQLASFGFYVPNKDHRRKPGKMNVYDMMFNKYEIYRHEAWENNKLFCFSLVQAKAHGISPLYEWIRAGEDDPLTYDIKLMQSIIDDIRCVSLRRTVCVLLWQGINPEQIRSIIETDFRAPPIRWDEHQIGIFMKFFWQVTNMHHNDWLRYGDMQEIPEDDEHYIYLAPIIKQMPKQNITWHGDPIGDIDNIVALEMIKAQQLEDSRFDTNKDFRLRSGNAAAKTISAMEKILLDRKVLSTNKAQKNPLEDVELMIQEKRAEQVGMAPAFMSVSEIDGDVSDPRDTESSKDDYLNQ